MGKGKRIEIQRENVEEKERERNIKYMEKIGWVYYEGRGIQEGGGKLPNMILVEFSRILKSCQSEQMFQLGEAAAEWIYHSNYSTWYLRNRLKS